MLFQDLCSTGNKTGLQPVSRPVEQILGFHPKGVKIYPKGIIIRKNGSKITVGSNMARAVPLNQELQGA